MNRGNLAAHQRVKSSQADINGTRYNGSQESTSLRNAMEAVSMKLLSILHILYGSPSTDSNWILTTIRPSLEKMKYQPTVPRRRQEGLVLIFSRTLLLRSALVAVWD